MTIDTKIKQQIYQIIEELPDEELSELLHFLQSLSQKEIGQGVDTPIPIYQVHQHAIDTGISDLAAEHDHYLYGLSKEGNG